VVEFLPERPRVKDSAPPEHQVNGSNPGKEAEQTTVVRTGFSAVSMCKDIESKEHKDIEPQVNLQHWLCSTISPSSHRAYNLWYHLLQTDLP